MKVHLFLFFAGLMYSGRVCSAEAPVPKTPIQSVPSLLEKLKSECDNPQISNESQWLSYCSATELKRMDTIAALQASGFGTETQVRRELAAAQGEYRQMLVIVLAALGDNTSIWQTSQLMLKAKLPAVRVCAAHELRRLRDKRVMESLQAALSDPFERRDGGCVGPRMIFPVRLIAAGALTSIGLSLEEVRQIERQQFVAKLQADFENLAQAQTTWQHLLGDLEANQPVFPYNGQQVVLKGTALSTSNPILVKIDRSAVTCQVFLRKQEAEIFEDQGKVGCRVEIQGVVRSTDTTQKQVEVWSTHSVGITTR